MRGLRSLNRIAFHSNPRMQSGAIACVSMVAGRSISFGHDQGLVCDQRDSWVLGRTPSALSLEAPSSGPSAQTAQNLPSPLASPENNKVQNRKGGHYQGMVYNSFKTNPSYRLWGGVILCKIHSMHLCSLERFAPGGHESIELSGAVLAAH